MIAGVENGPRIGERGEISPCSPTLGAPMRFSQTAFSFAPDKRPEDILNPKEVISGQQRLHRHTHTEGAFRPGSAKDAHICRGILTTQIATSVGGEFSDERTLKANGAPPEAFRRLSEDHSRFRAADADRGSFEAQNEDHLRRPA